MPIQRLGERDVILTDRLPSMSQEDVQLFVRRLHASILSYGLYPPGHSLIVKRTQDLHSHLVKLFGNNPLLVIRCDQSLSVNNTRLLRDVPEREHAIKTASYMGLRGVKNIVIWPDVEHGELGELIQSLHSINEEEEDESSDWVQQYRSYHVRLNMDLVDSVELESAYHGGHQPPIAISKQELAELISQVGPNAQRAPGRSSSSPIQLVDSPGGGQSGSFGTSQGSMSGVMQAGGVVQAQQVVQQVGGQVVQAQQVIQQNITSSGGEPSDSSGMIYPPRQGHPPPSTAFLPGGTPPGGHAYPGNHSNNIYSYDEPLSGSAPRGPGHPLRSEHGTASHPHAPGHAPPGYSVHNLQQGPPSSPDTGLPPGLRQPAAYHPARQGSELPFDDLPTAPEPYDGDPMGPGESHYGAPSGPGDGYYGTSSGPGESHYGAPPGPGESYYGAPPGPGESYYGAPVSQGQYGVEQGGVGSHFGSPVVPGLYDTNPVGPTDHPYESLRSEEKTKIQRVPGNSSVAALLESSRNPDPNVQTGQFKIGEVTPSVEDLPEVQGYVLEGAFSPSAAPNGPASGGLYPPGSSFGAANGEPGFFGGAPSLTGRDSSFVPGNPGYMGGNPGEGSAGLTGGVAEQPSSVGGIREIVSGGHWSASNYALPPDWVTVDPVSLDQSDLDLSQLDFGKIEPGSLFQSQRFQEFLGGDGGAGLFLSRFLATAMGAVEPTPSGHVSAVRSEGGWLGTGAGRALLGAVEQLDGVSLQKGLLHSLAETISSTIPELMDEQIAQLGQSKSEQMLRKEVIQQVSPEQRVQLGEMLVHRLQGEDRLAQIDNCMTTVLMLTEESLDDGLWRMLVPTLETLAQRKAESEDGTPVHRRLSEWIDKAATPSVGRMFFQQFLHAEEEAVREEARRGILSMGAASAYNLTLFLELANDSRSEQLLFALVQDIGKALDDVEQALFLEQIWAAGEALPPSRHAGLCQSMYRLQSGFVEAHIVEKFDALEQAENFEFSKDDWAHWAELALECHTPRLREYLGRYMQKRKFMDHPHIEERMLKLLDDHGTIQAFQFLERLIHNEHQDSSEKNSAVWLLGCLRSEEALLLLRKILLERRRFLRQPVYPMDMRYQALDALRHFPHHQIGELVKKVLQDPEEPVRIYAQKMLDIGARS